MFTWKKVSELLITKALRFGANAKIKILSAAGVETEIGLSELAALDNLDATELGYLNGAAPGVAAVSKAMVVGATGHIRMPDNGRFRFSTESIAAAGTNQATAASLTSQICAVTASDGTKGVALPAASAVESVLVINTVATADLKVYPVNGGDDAINGLTAGTGSFTLARGSAAWFIAVSATQWYVQAVSGVVPGTGAVNQPLVLDTNGNVLMPAGGLINLDRATLAATGSAQSDAAAVAKQITVVSGADGAKGVALPAAGAAVGPYVIYSSAAAMLFIYPVNGGDDTINNMAANVPLHLAAGEMAIFTPTSATAWFASTFVAQNKPRQRDRATVADTGTVTVANMRTGILYQSASGGNVTMTTPAATDIVAAFPHMRNGDSIEILHASNHAANTSTLAAGSGVTLVGSGAVTNEGGRYEVIRQSATAVDWVRCG